MIEIRLERRRHAEVVHRQPEDDHVGGLELVDERVRIRGVRGLRERAVLGLGEEGLEALGGEVRDRVLREVAREHAAAMIRRLPLRDIAVGEPARLPAVGKDARLDLEKRFHDRLRMVVDASISSKNDSIKKRKMSALLIELADI